MCGRIRTEGSIRMIGVIALLATAAILSFAGSASAMPLDYTFTSNNQGWQQSQDNGKTFSPAGFHRAGATPAGASPPGTAVRRSGCSTATDPCNLLTFYSPFVHEKLGANYGGSASFDLRSSVDPAIRSRAIPASERTRLSRRRDLRRTREPAITRSRYRLDETADWNVCPYAGGSCTTPTQAVFQSLIADSDEIAVMVDVGPNETGETYDLDNVTLTDGGPPPPPGAPPPTKKLEEEVQEAHEARRCREEGQVQEEAARCGGSQRLTTEASTWPSRQRS